MRQIHGLTQPSRRLALVALLVPAAFGLAFLMLELGSIALGGAV
ncbi:MAG TPA: hypothetical protein VKV26_24480 [Dehalococcoidia bacterium]|nr:hypothetical protein [Dehalococcoidia bacterium]